MRSLSPRLHHTAMPSVDMPSELSEWDLRVSEASCVWWGNVTWDLYVSLILL